MPGGEVQNLVQLLVPTDQLGNRLRKVRWRQGRSGLRWRELRTVALVWARRQNADLAGELIAASGDRPDQLAFRPESGAQRRNLGVQISTRPGHTRAISASLVTRAPRASINTITKSNARPPSLIGRPSARTSRRYGITRNRPNATLAGCSEMQSNQGNPIN
jgi:hypothetical protein